MEENPGNKSSPNHIPEPLGSLSRSKFSIIQSALNIDSAYATKVIFTNMSVLLTMNKLYSQTVSFCRCCTCTWRNVKCFTQSTRCHHDIYMVDARQPLCTNMNSHIQSIHKRNVQISREGISQKTVTPSPILWMCSNLHKGNIRKTF